MVIFDLASAFEYFIKPVRRLFSWWIIPSSILFLSVHSQMQIQEKIFRKNKEISPFYNKLSTNFVPNLKIYPYLKKKKKRKEKRQAELLDETEIFPRGSGWYNPSIVEKSAPTLGKQRTTKCSVDEGIKRKINIPSRDKLGDGIRVKSSPTPPTSKSFVIRSIENALRRWTDARILAPDFLISLPSKWFVRGSHYDCISHRRNITSFLLFSRSIKMVARANYLSNKFSKKKKRKNRFVVSSRWSINHASNFEKNCSFSSFFFETMKQKERNPSKDLRVVWWGKNGRAYVERSSTEEFSCGHRGEGWKITTLIFDSLITPG